MPSDLLYAVARLDRDTSRKMSEIQHALLSSGIVGRQTPDIPYHITLGAFPVARRQEACDILEQVCRTLSAFTVDFNHIGLFGLQVLFLAPDVNRELLDLQRYFDDGHPWTAHATLLVDEPSMVLKALPIVADHFKSLQARIESIGLYEVLPTRCVCEGMLREKL